jgi:cytochrome d ubiquinol oxidase subunit I
VLFTLIGFAGMYLLLGLFYVVLVVYEALRGPVPKEERPQEVEGLTDQLAEE